MPNRPIADLNCHIEEETAEPRAAVILCHGYGAPGTDLVPIGAELRRIDPAVQQSVCFYFPAAPIDMGPHGLPGGRAWWPINMEQLVEAAESGRWEDVRDAMPEGLEAASDQLLATCAAIKEECGLPWSRIVIGGFSQGAMLATDVTLRLPEPTGGLLIASGTLLSQETWTNRAKALPTLNVIQSHGRQDPLLPFSGAEALRDMLTEAGHSVTFLPFDGGHTIVPEVLGELGRRVSALAAKG